MEGIAIDVEERWDKGLQERLEPRLINFVGSERVVQVGQQEVTSIVNDIHIFESVPELVFGHEVGRVDSLAALFLVPHLNFGLKCFGLELTFVGALDIDTLVIETFPEDLVCLYSPDFIPLSLR